MGTVPWRSRCPGGILRDGSLEFTASGDGSLEFTASGDGYLEFTASGGDSLEFNEVIYEKNNILSD